MSSPSLGPELLAFPYAFLKTLISQTLRKKNAEGLSTSKRSFVVAPEPNTQAQIPSKLQHLEVSSRGMCTQCLHSALILRCFRGSVLFLFPSTDRTFCSL